MSSFAISNVRSLDLDDDHCKHMSPFSFSILLDLCSRNLEIMKFSAHINQRSLVNTFALYSCSRLVELDIGIAAIDDGVFEKLVRKNWNLQSLVLRSFDQYFRDFLHNRYPNGVRSEKMTSLVLRCCNNSTVRSLTGRVPNLKTFKTTLNNVSDEAIENFFLATPLLEVLDLRLENNSVYFDQLAWFWHLSSMDSLTIDFDGRCVANDGFMIKAAHNFPRLRNLVLKHVDVSEEGIMALGNLEFLEVLRLGSNEATNTDSGVRHLVHCKRLQEMSLPNSALSPTTFVKLIRSCHDLRVLLVDSIGGAVTPDTTADILLALSGCGIGRVRDLMVHVYCEDEYYNMVWNSELVHMALKQLELEDGLVIEVKQFQC